MPNQRDWHETAEIIPLNDWPLTMQDEDAHILLRYLESHSWGEP